MLSPDHDLILRVYERALQHVASIQEDLTAHLRLLTTQTDGGDNLDLSDLARLDGLRSERNEALLDAGRAERELVRIIGTRLGISLDTSADSAPA